MADDDWFSTEEAERRFQEVLRRCCGLPPTFDMVTGQSLNGPKLTAAELKRRGYDGHPPLET